MLTGNEVHIYRINIREHVNSLNGFRQLLSGDEINKADRFKFRKDSDTYLISRAHLRIILSEYLDTNPSSIKFSYAASGKPYIKDIGVYFNLSHSGKQCVIAVSQIPGTGVDIEMIRAVEDLIKISRRYFSDMEYGYLKQLPEEIQTKEFFKIWTLKEAFVKATGDGLTFPLKNFSVLTEYSAAPVLIFQNNEFQNEKNWKIGFLDCNEGYCSALAVSSADVNIIYK